MDKMPIRRRYKDNPYKLEKEEKKQIYKIRFKNNQGIKCSIKVNYEIYESFNQFELDDLKELNEFDRHLEHLEQTDEFLYKRALIKNENVEQLVEKKILLEELKKAINSLPDIQKERIIMYYFYDMTLEEIANKYDCSKVAIKYSVDKGIQNLKELLIN